MTRVNVTPIRGGTSGVSVVIPHIPTRGAMLTRALKSVTAQTLQPEYVIVATDDDRQGAAVTRTAGLNAVVTPWTALLDDDDEFLPIHLEALATHAEATGADYVFSDFVVPEHPKFKLDSFCYGEWDPERPMQTTITVLVRTHVARQFGFVMPGEASIGRDFMGEDFEFTRRVNEAGYKISHLQETTWQWRHHGKNSSGMSHRW